MSIVTGGLGQPASSLVAGGLGQAQGPAEGAIYATLAGVGGLSATIVANATAVATIDGSSSVAGMLSAGSVAAPVLPPENYGAGSGRWAGIAWEPPPRVAAKISARIGGGASRTSGTMTASASAIASFGGGSDATGRISAVASASSAVAGQSSVSARGVSAASAVAEIRGASTAGGHARVAPMFEGFDDDEILLILMAA